MYLCATVVSHYSAKSKMQLSTLGLISLACIAYWPAAECARRPERARTRHTGGGACPLACALTGDGVCTDACDTTKCQFYEDQAVCGIGQPPVLCGYRAGPVGLLPGFINCNGLPRNKNSLLYNLTDFCSEEEIEAVSHSVCNVCVFL